jgi:1-phosphatidylinositol-3-phosphate 5-kinase
MEFAIHNDTLFLQKHKIVDYSMLLIMDLNKNVLRLGIIDYLLTYTLDRWMETRLKKLLAGTEKDPTIVAPMFYKERFRN